MEPQELESLVAAHAGRPGALLVVAEALMDRLRVIPPPALPLLAAHLGLPLAEVRSVLSFYRYPVADAPPRVELEICNALTCRLKGAHALLAAAANAAGAHGAALRVTTAHCLSACDAAPAAALNGELHGALTPAQLTALLRAALA